MLIISVRLVVIFNNYLTVFIFNNYLLVAIYNSLVTKKTVTSYPSPHQSSLWLTRWMPRGRWPHYYFGVEGYAH